MGLLSFVDGKVRFDPGGSLLRQRDREAQVEAELEYQRRLAEQQQAAARQQAGLMAPDLAKQLRASGMVGPEAQTAVGLMMRPGTRGLGVEQAQGLLTPLTTRDRTELAQQESQFSRSFALRERESALEQQRLQTQIGAMGLENALRVSKANLDMLQAGFSRSGDLRKEVNADPVVQKTQQALTSYRQLLAATKLAEKPGNRIALQSAIVALVQVQEPGLAVRNDDRIAYTGNNSVTQNLVDDYNKLVSGSAPASVLKRMQVLGTALVKPQAEAARQIIGQYRSLAERTPGASPDDVTIGTGIDMDILAALLDAR